MPEPHTPIPDRASLQHSRIDGVAGELQQARLAAEKDERADQIGGGLNAADEFHDHIQIVGHPARTNAYELRANHITMPNGDELNMNNPYVSIPFLQQSEGTD